jgi:hypothetical protein
MKNIMKPICLLLFLVFATSYIQAQDRSKEDRIKAVKAAFITEELALTPEQSQNFWPLYNELQNKLDGYKKGEREKPDFDKMSDAELEAWLDGHLKQEEERIALQRAYIQKFKAVITMRQIVKLSMAERRFKKELLEHIQERREGEKAHNKGF